MCIKRSARCDRNFCLWFVWSEEEALVFIQTVYVKKHRFCSFFFSLPLNEPCGRYGRVYHVTGSQWMIIDSIMLCPWSCINQESLFSVPDGFQEVVFFFGGNVFCDGARRGKKRECEIPKSVGALHQSADALILTTDLFHLAASACPIQNNTLKTRALWELDCPPPPNPSPLLSGHPEDDRSRGWRPAWCNQNRVDEG